MIEQMTQLLANSPDLLATLFALFSGGPSAAAVKVYRQNRYLTAALLQIHATHTDELNVLREENMRLSEMHAADMKRTREHYEKKLSELATNLLGAFTKGL